MRHQVASVYTVFQFVLSVLGDRLPVRLQTGGFSLERPISSRTYDYETFPEQYPATEPVPKLDAGMQV